MPTTVICPACDSQVETESTSGSVQCPTCWAKVAVESARKKPADTPPPVAKRATNKDGIPVARPVWDDDEDVDDEPRGKRGRKTRSRRAPQPKKKDNGWVWALALLVVVVIVGIGVVGYCLMNPPATASTAPTPAPTKPPEVFPDDTEDRTEWVMVATPEGARLLAPGPLDQQKVTVQMPGEPAALGGCHTAADAQATAAVYVFDLKENRRADRETFLGKLLQVNPAAFVRNGVRPIPGGDATELSASDPTGFDHAVLVLGREGRWFVFHVRWRPDDDPKERRRDAFVAKAGVTWLRLGDLDPVPPVKPKDPKPADPKPNEAKPKDPPKPRDPRTEAEPITETWAEIENKAGFTAVAPKGARPEKVFVTVNRVVYGGKKWQADDAHAVYLVGYLDLPSDSDPDEIKLVKPFVPFGHDVGTSNDAKVDGRRATEWQLKQWEKPRSKAFTVACGFRVFTALAVSKRGTGLGDDATFTQRADKFFAGLKFTFDPKADDAYAGEANWGGFPNANGFTAKVPKGTTANKAHDLGGNPKIPGRQYRHEAGGMVFEVYTHDLPPKRAAGDVAKDLIGFDKLVSGPDDVRSNDRRWTTYELGSPDRPVLFRTTAVGKRVFTLRVYPEPSGDDRAGAREFRDKASRFFENFEAEE